MKTIDRATGSRKRSRDYPRSTLAAADTRRIAELLLDADQLVVFRQPVGAGQRAGLDLTAIGGDRQIGDGRVLGLARAVRHHRGVARPVRDLDRVQGFRQACRSG